MSAGAAPAFLYIGRSEWHVYIRPFWHFVYGGSSDVCDERLELDYSPLRQSRGLGSRHPPNV